MYNVLSVAIRKREHNNARQWKILVHVCQDHVGLVGIFWKTTDDMQMSYCT